MKKFISIFDIPKRLLPDISEIPESFYIGQNYVEDRVKVNCSIETNFYFLAEVESYDFDFEESKVSVRQSEHVLQVHIFRKISEQLWKDVLRSGGEESFILPYISKILPEVNHHLLKQRYIKGHILSRTFSLIDAQSIFVVNGKKRVQLKWPQNISGFPPTIGLAAENDEIYLRDYIDAMHSYFKNDYDDCIRRIITSVNNVINTRKLKAVGGETEFANILRSNLDANIYSNSVILENLLFIYKLRNKIVHDRFRMKTSDGWICRKALGTLNYFLQRHRRDENMFRYIMSLGMQFLALQNFLGEFGDLDVLERIDHNAPIDPDRIINTKEDIKKFDRNMFESLLITEDEKLVALK